MKHIILILCAVVFALGCARVKVEAPKDPIKVDISMRLDIYQHIEKDITAIEDIVSSGKEQAKVFDEKQGFLSLIVNNAYAQESLSPEVEQAALRRKKRVAELNSLQSKGIVGEDKLGLAQIRKRESLDYSVDDLVNAENQDRMVIYNSVAKKNGSTVEDVQKIYAKRLQQDAPSGTPVEILDETGSYQWKNK